MRRLATIAGIIILILIGFSGAILLKLRSGRPEVLIESLRKGTGDKEVLKMKLNLIRGDTVGLMIEAFGDESAPAAFRVDMLELLLKKYRRSNDQRIKPVLMEALGSGDATIRRAAVWGIDTYCTEEDRLYLVDRLEDTEPDIRKVAYSSFCTATRGMRGSDRSYDKGWENIPEDKREIIVQKCVRQMRTEVDSELRFLAKSVVGRQIAYLCDNALQGLGSGNFIKAEKLVRRALALDPNSQHAQIRLVRHFLAVGKRDDALKLAGEYGAVIDIPLLTKAPKIDGDPTEDAWKGAFRYVGQPFYHTTSRWAAKQVTGKTDLYMGHRDGAIYIAVVAYEDDLGKLIVKHKTRDSNIWLDDCVEIFLDPECGESMVYQFIINPAGALFDSYATRLSENILCQAGADVFHDRGYWACEFAVSAEDLQNQRITAESLWGFNLARVRIGAASEHSMWWPTFGWAHRYHLFAVAVFDGLDTTGTSRAQAATAPK